MERRGRRRSDVDGQETGGDLAAAMGADIKIIPLAAAAPAVPAATAAGGDASEGRCWRKAGARLHSQICQCAWLLGGWRRLHCCALAVDWQRGCRVGRAGVSSRCRVSSSLRRATRSKGGQKAVQCARQEPVDCLAHEPGCHSGSSGAGRAGSQRGRRGGAEALTVR